ncbi:MAG: hybrid sensor histidine kinase/response regulator [Anaerolineae bacterium]|nr:hybrid sensor histidine kinase/response regulator [Anaerolineae bacterium]
MAATGTQQTILVVEDEPYILEIVSFLLTDEGYHVLKATNGLDALAVVGSEKPDLIISDVKMPGMDGFALCEQVRQDPNLAQTPFIFLTAKSERGDIRHGMGLGADDYLIKPFEPEELLAAVSARFARAAQTQAAIDRVGADLQDSIIRTLTHEFRTPLALIVGYTELLESSGQEMVIKELESILEGLHTGSARLMTLVEDFLLLSKLSTGALQRQVASVAREPISPDLVIASRTDVAADKARSRRVALLTDCQAPAARIAILKEHLVEIVDRLIDNAIKFSKPTGGRVTVATVLDGERWRLTVADEGIGMRAEALPWIFEAFRQVDRDKLEQQGSGVGLTIVRGLVEGYGGTITVRSAPGEGSTFSIWLPCALTS